MTISRLINDNTQDYQEAEEMIEQVIAGMGEKTHIEYESATSRNDKPPRYKLVSRLFGKLLRLFGHG